MIVKILENGNPVRSIVADEAFAADYCARHGYTYELEPEEELPAPEPEPSPEEQITRLRAQVAMLQEQQTFLEDCLLEMAEEVYA